MSGARFQVRESEGWPIVLPVKDVGASTNRLPSLQALVCDTAYAWRAVGVWDTAALRRPWPRERKYSHVRAEAAAEAARLNAWAVGA